MHLSMDQLLRVNLLNNLILGCKKGDRQSQSRLYMQFASTMLVVCMRYARTREEAEEILQEGFLQVFTKIQQFRGEGSFEGWIRKIMVNTSLQRLRAKSYLTKVVSVDELQIEDLNPALPVETLATKELIGIIQGLPPMYKAVFNLYVFEGMKHREIAETLGISEGTSKSNLSDARTLLQQELNRLNQIAKPINF